MIASPTLVTAEELFNLSPDGLRRELIRGEMTTMSPAGDLHGARTGRITVRLGSYIEEHDLGVYFGAETGFILTHEPDTVLAPDFAFVAKARLEKQAMTGKFYAGAPDFAVEVLSPSDSAGEMLEKIGEWLEAGARLVWVVDPQKKTVSVHAPNRQPRIMRLHEHLSGEDVLPGLNLAVADIFR